MPEPELVLLALLGEREFPYHLAAVERSTKAMSAVAGTVSVHDGTVAGKKKYGALEWLRFPLFDRLGALLRPMLPAHRKAFFVWTALNAAAIDKLPNPFLHSAGAEVPGAGASS